MPAHEPKLQGHKKCSVCKEEKLVICFSVDKRVNDGLQAACRECQAERSKRRAACKRQEKAKYCQAIVMVEQ